MTLVQAIVTFTLIWWTFLFCVLPWGNAPSQDPMAGETGNVPAKPRLGLKFLITTGLSVIIFLIVYGLIEANVLDFYAMAQNMEKQDGLR